MTTTTTTTSSAAPFSATYRSSDGASKRSTFKTLAGLAGFIDKWVGRTSIHGNTATSFDGVGQVIFNGATAEQIIELLATPAPTRRAPVKALNQSAEQIATAAAAEKARKAESRAALRAARKAEQAEAQAPAAEQPAAPAVDHRAEDAAAALATAIADADATGVTLEEMLESMGIDAQGYPAIPVLGSPRAPRAGDRPKYDGPMLALRRAAVAYVTPLNGNPCNGDELATLCGTYSREVVVRALIDAMLLPGNPYLHLNPGQQSMNLRNKARAQIKAGTLTLDAVRTQLNIAYILSPEFAARQEKEGSVITDAIAEVQAQQQQ